MAKLVGLDDNLREQLFDNMPYVMTWKKGNKPSINQAYKYIDDNIRLQLPLSATEDKAPDYSFINDTFCWAVKFWNNLGSNELANDDTNNNCRSYINKVFRDSKHLSLVTKMFYYSLLFGGPYSFGPNGGNTCFIAFNDDWEDTTSGGRKERIFKYATGRGIDDSIVWTIESGAICTEEEAINKWEQGKRIIKKVRDWTETGSNGGGWYENFLNRHTQNTLLNEICDNEQVPKRFSDTPKYSGFANVLNNEFIGKIPQTVIYTIDRKADDGMGGLLNIVEIVVAVATSLISAGILSSFLTPILNTSKNIIVKGGNLGFEDLKNIATSVLKEAGININSDITNKIEITAGVVADYKNANYTGVINKLGFATGLYNADEIVNSIQNSDVGKFAGKTNKTIKELYDIGTQFRIINTPNQIQNKLSNEPRTLCSPLENAQIETSNEMRNFFTLACSNIYTGAIRFVVEKNIAGNKIDEDMLPSIFYGAFKPDVPSNYPYDYLDVHERYAFIKASLGIPVGKNVFDRLLCRSLFYLGTQNNNTVTLPAELPDNKKQIYAKILSDLGVTTNIQIGNQTIKPNSSTNKKPNPISTKKTIKKQNYFIHQEIKI